jgi:hypothetical protein
VLREGSLRLAFGRDVLEMSLRHAAALALAGWYFMIPKMVPDPKGGVPYADTTVPLSQWSIEQSFDTATECEAERDEFAKKWSTMASQAKNARDTGRALVWQVSSVCIATDDPRLKPK